MKQVVGLGVKYANYRIRRRRLNIANEPGISNVRNIRITASALHSDNLSELMHSPYLRKLRSLCLYDNECDDEIAYFIHAITQSPIASQLERFILVTNDSNAGEMDDGIGAFQSTMKLKKTTYIKHKRRNGQSFGSLCMDRIPKPPLTHKSRYQPQYTHK